MTTFTAANGENAMKTVGNEIKKYTNNKPQYGDEGLFEAENREELADMMTPHFEQWESENCGMTVDEMREDFINGLEEVEDSDGNTYDSDGNQW